MSITNEDRYAVLERKLMEAESALFGCRQILNHIIRQDTEDDRGDRVLAGTSEKEAGTASGLYPGQYPAPTACEPEKEEECVE